MGTRGIHIILQVALDNKKYFRSGLCNWFYELWCLRLINTSEYLLINRYIKSNKPFLAELFNKYFYWRKGDIKPRIKWIEKHISIHRKIINKTIH